MTNIEGVHFTILAAKLLEGLEPSCLPNFTPMMIAYTALA